MTPSSRVLMALVLVGLIVVGCAQPTATPAPTATPTQVPAAPTEAPTVEPSPTLLPEGWVDTSQYAKEPPYRVHWAVYRTAGSPWMVSMADVMTREWASHPGVELTISDGQFDQAKLVADIEDAIARGVDLIMATPMDPESATATLAQAYQMGIPVVLVLKRVSGDQFTAEYFDNDVDLGRMQGEALIDELIRRKGAPEGNVVIVNGVTGASNTIERTQGFMEVMDQYENVHVLADQPADFRRDLAMSVTEDMLQTFPELDAIFSWADDMAIGCVLAVEAAGREDEIFVIGGSANMEALEMMMDGRVIVADLYYPDCVPEAVEGGWKILHGEPIQKQNVIEGFMIWADEAADYYDADKFRVE